MKNKLITMLMLIEALILACPSLHVEAGSETNEETVATVQEDLANGYAGVMVALHENVSVEKHDCEQTVFDIAENEFSQHMDSLVLAEDLKEWYIEYKEIVSKYSDWIDSPETIYDYFTEEELDLLFRVVQAEIGSDYYTFEQKCNVASVIFNRLESEKFGNSVDEILISSQFASISNGSYRRVEVSEDVILACEYAFEIGDTTNGALFFDSNGFLNYYFLFNDGAHNFYTTREVLYERVYD